MNRFPANILAAMAVVLTGSAVFGQVQQVGHHNCQQCQQGNFIGYQSCDWNQCGSGRGISRIWTDCSSNHSCLGQCCATKAYPDAGWAAPVRLPVNYDGVWYGNYQPQVAYGLPGGGFIGNYPVVYQPTDTTQLGCYYQKVPTWQTRPGMIPPVPRPSDYHARMCLGGGQGCYGGGTCQTRTTQGYVMNIPQYMTPVSTPVVRHAQPQKQGAFGGFRFASLTEMFE